MRFKLPTTPPKGVDTKHVFASLISIQKQLSDIRDHAYDLSSRSTGHRAGDMARLSEASRDLSDAVNRVNKAVKLLTEDISRHGITGQE